MPTPADPAAPGQEGSALLRLTSGSVTTLTLNRPQRLNALDRELCLALIAAVEEVAADPGCRCLVLTGAGRAFCAGQYLGKGGDDQLPEDIEGLIRERYTPLVLGLRRLPIPVLAAVNGLATGAGLSLALAADLRICSDAAWFSCGFAQIGLVPDSGATYFLPRLLGPSLALHLALTGERLSADQALRAGLVTRVTPADSFAAEVGRFSEELAAGATSALGMTKELIYGGLERELTAQLELEARFQQAAARTSDFQEGLAAFRERRQPHFQGS
ncbi:MAG: enoyl-CoA hydratase-related protein [Candidatus Dormiibacterota bacterium]